MMMPEHEEPFADLSDRDHVQRMIFTLPIDEHLLTGWVTPTERSTFLHELFTDYLLDVVPYRHYLTKWPTRVEEPADPRAGFEFWQVEVAVIMRPDENLQERAVVIRRKDGGLYVDGGRDA